jgi:hypothetical protein
MSDNVPDVESMSDEEFLDHLRRLSLEVKKALDQIIDTEAGLVDVKAAAGNYEALPVEEHQPDRQIEQLRSSTDE